MIDSRPPDQLGHFEERLLAELTAVVEQRAASPATAVPGRRRRLVPAAAALLTVVAGAVLAAVHLGLGAEPAYAVDRQADGSVLISINDANRLDGLPQRLKDVGVAAVVVPVSAACTQPRLDPARARLWVVLEPVTPVGGRARIRVLRNNLTPGTVLVIGLAGDHTPIVLGAAPAAAAPTCQPPAAVSAPSVPPSSGH